MQEAANKQKRMTLKTLHEMLNGMSVELAEKVHLLFMANYIDYSDYEFRDENQVEGYCFSPERIDDPDVLVKYLSWFHDCKVKKKSPNLQILLKKIGSCLCCMLHVAKSILKNRCWEGERYNNKSYIYYIYYNIYKIICN